MCVCLFFLICFACVSYIRGRMIFYICLIQCCCYWRSLLIQFCCYWRSRLIQFCCYWRRLLIQFCCYWRCLLILFFCSLFEWPSHNPNATAVRSPRPPCLRTLFCDSFCVFLAIWIIDPGHALARTQAKQLAKPRP